MIDLDELRRTIERGYGIRTQSLVELDAGVRTTNLRALTDAGELFVKVYPASASLARELGALSLGALACTHGVPVPETLPTLRGELLLADENAALSLHRWCPGRSLTRLDLRAAASGARALGMIHRTFLTLPESSQTSMHAERFFVYDSIQRRDWFGHLQSLARQRSDAFAQRAVPLLERRIELLAAAPLHLPRLAKLPTQVGHGDSSVLNFLFTDEGAVAGVVDFGPPEPYFRDFELSRIAFDPETLASCDNWREIAQSALAAYLEVFPAARVPSLALGPALWLCHLLRSDLGVKQHLLDPHPTQQARLDRYWECRCAAAEILLRELAPLEAEIADLVRAG